MQNYSYPLILVALVALSGCKSMGELTRETRIVYEPVEVTKVVEKYVPLSDDLLKACPITHGKDRSVKEYVRVANTNTPALEQCAKQINEIKKLQPRTD